MTSKPGNATSALFRPEEAREHRRLRNRWAVGVATKAEIMRCIELDRRSNWLERRRKEKA